jgi:hypothetical protein
MSYNLQLRPSFLSKPTFFDVTCIHIIFDEPVLVKLAVTDCDLRFEKFAPHVLFGADGFKGTGIPGSSDMLAAEQWQGHSSPRRTAERLERGQALAGPARRADDAGGWFVLGCGSRLNSCCMLNSSLVRAYPAGVVVVDSYSMEAYSYDKSGKQFTFF